MPDLRPGDRLLPVPRGMDVRLLAAAGAGWAAVFGALLVTPVVSLVVAAVLAGAVVVCWRRARHLETADRPRGGERRSRRWRSWGLLVGVTAVMLLAAGCHQLVRQAGTVDGLAAERATVHVRGVVLSDPRLVGSQGRFGESIVVVRLGVREVEGRGVVSTPHTPVLVMGDKTWMKVKWHQTVAAVGRLAPAERGGDVEAIFDPAATPPRVVGQPGALLRAIGGLRSSMRQATAHLPADPRGLVPALVIGDTGRVSARLRDDMRATGMTHLTAVSGSNVTFVLMAVMWLCGAARLPRRSRLPIALAALGLFVLLCRPEPSVIRAAVMGVVGLVGVSLSRRRSGPAALGTAVVVLLLINPWLARSYGFALSTLATAGLLFLARPWGERFARALPRRLRWLGFALAVPLAAQVACAPVIVLLQGSVSIIGIPANLLAAPLVAPATLAGVVTVVVAPLGAGLSWLPSWAAGLPAWGIAEIAHRLAHVPFGMMPWPGGAAGALALAAVSVTLLLCGPWLLQSARSRPWPAAAVGVVVLAALVPTGEPGWPPAGWVYVACDVGQGDGGVISTGGGHVVVIDTGPDPALMDACLDRLQVHVIDAVVLTHFHADHVGGLAGVVDGRTVREIFVTTVKEGDDGGEDAEPAEAPMVRRIAGTHGIPMHDLSTGDVLRWGDVSARVLWPSRTIHAGSVQNNGSVVLDLRSHGLRLLFAGDIEREAAAEVRRELDRLPDGPHFDVLKVAHHGSSNQDADLVHEVSAQVAVISVGADNDYGHPAPSTLDLLRESGSRVMRTDRMGDIAVVSVDGRLRVATRGT